MSINLLNSRCPLSSKTFLSTIAVANGYVIASYMLVLVFDHTSFSLEWSGMGAYTASNEYPMSGKHLLTQYHNYSCGHTAAASTVY